MSEPRRATAADLSGASTLLAEAFADDPVYEHLLPRTVRHRHRRLVRSFEIDVARSIRYDSTWQFDDRGVAVWYPPGRALETGRDLLRALPAYLRAFGRRLPVANRVATTLAHHHPPEPHWYLLYLGTTAAAQGSGVGSRLLAAMLARCDARGEAAYLEATGERNRALYRRHGFVDREPLTLPDDGPPMYPMWRDPQSG